LLHGSAGSFAGRSDIHGNRNCTTAAARGCGIDTARSGGHKNLRPTLTHKIGSAAGYRPAGGTPWQTKQPAKQSPNTGRSTARTQQSSKIKLKSVPADIAKSGNGDPPQIIKSDLAVR
jgi:hypothetical protein